MWIELFCTPCNPFYSPSPKKETHTQKKLPFKKKKVYGFFPLARQLLNRTGDLIPFLTMRGYISSDIALLITRNVEEISFGDNEAPLEIRINLGTMRLLLEGQRALSSAETLPISSLAETCVDGDVIHSGSSVDEEADDESVHNDEPFNSPPSIFTPTDEFVPGSELRRVSGRRILPKINGHDGTLWMCTSELDSPPLFSKSK